MSAPLPAEQQESNVVALPVRRAPGAPQQAPVDPAQVAELIELIQRCGRLIEKARTAAAGSAGTRAGLVEAMTQRVATLERELAATAVERDRLREDIRTGAATTPPDSGTPVDPALVLAAARPVRGRRLMVWLAILALIVGILAVVDAFMTLVFQEPITKLMTARAQSSASADLEKLETSFADAERLERETAANRRARLASSLAQSAGPGEPLGRLLIPSIGLRTVFIEGASETALRSGPGRYVETSMPGRPGTVGIAGHRTTFAAPFRHIDRLKPGHRIILRMPYARFSYVVERKRIVSPQDAWVLRSYGNGGDVLAAEKESRLVLTACHPIGSAAERIVVSARLASVRDMA